LSLFQNRVQAGLKAEVVFPGRQEQGEDNNYDIEEV